MNILANLENRTRIFQFGLGLTLVFAIGILDLLTGYELSFSIVYVIPISLITWIANKRLGILVSFASALVWYAADLISGHTYSSHFIPVWNTVIRLSFFVIISMLLSKIKSAMEKEKEYARTDGLTGAYNSRFFYELVAMEIMRLQRYDHPFTLVYFDLDNFKSVNDQFGHIAGDRVLRNVVSCIKTNLRKTDVIARVGGDEFALLLP